MSSQTSISIIEICVIPKDSFKPSKSLSVSLGVVPLNPTYQGITGAAHTWKFSEPLTLLENQTLKIQLFKQKLFGVKGAGDAIEVSYTELLYAEGEWTISYSNFDLRLVLINTESKSSIRSPSIIPVELPNGNPHLRHPSWSHFASGDEGTSDIDKHEEPLPLDENGELPAATDAIASICPRFRILVIGKTGVGKSSLINRTFGVDQASVSEDAPGRADINFEITSKDNDHFVVHDSRGFEHGESKSLETVCKFIEQRRRMPQLKDKLHAIWLCTEVPSAGGRVFERGDEIFLREPIHHVPVIVVFTKWDNLIMAIDYKLPDNDDVANLPPIAEAENASEARRVPRLRLQDTERAAVVTRMAEKVFENDCVQPLLALAPNATYARVSTKAKYESTLQDLIAVTMDRVRESVAEVAAFTSGMAQRVSPEVKIRTCIEVGKKRYWRALASSADFPGKTIKVCLNVIHKDIIAIWNFQNPDSYLLSDEFKASMTAIVDDLADKEAMSPNKVLAGVASVISATAGAVPAALPAVLPIGAVIAIAAWALQVYKRSHSTLRCLMGYIVDLTLIMQMLFASQEPFQDSYSQLSNELARATSFVGSPRRDSTTTLVSPASPTLSFTSTAFVGSPPKMKASSIMSKKREPSPAASVLAVTRKQIQAVCTTYGRSDAKAHAHAEIRNFVEGLSAFDRRDSRQAVRKIEELVLRGIEQVEAAFI